MTKTSSSQEKKVALLGSRDAGQEDVWIIDSGATDHMSRRREWFSSYEEFEEPISINSCNGSPLIAYGKGKVDFECIVNGVRVSGAIHDILYMPEIVHNLFSVKSESVKGLDFYVKNNGANCFFKRGEETIVTGSEYGNLFKLDITVLLPRVCDLIKRNEPVSLRVWHERLCHQGVRHVKSFLKSNNINFLADDFVCEGCAYGKMHWLPFHDRKDRARKVRETVFTDVCGPMEVESVGRKLYYVCFKDDFSSFRVIYFIRHKSEVFEKLKIYCVEIENSFSERIKELHSDGGKEYDNRQISEYLAGKGIKFTINAPFTPEQNGVVERENRIIVEAARSMIYSNPDLPKFLWAEAMITAVYVINRTGPTKHGGKTPYELWHGKAPDISNLKVFGTECFVHVPKEKRRKLDSKALKGFVVGYHGNHMGYRVYVPEKKDVIVSRDVLFKPEQVCRDMVDFRDLGLGREVTEDLVEDPDDETVIHDESFGGETVDDAISDETLPEPPQPVIQPVGDDGEGGRKLRGASQRKPTDFFGCRVSFLAEKLPSNYNEAVKSGERNEWEAAMREEMDSLHKNQTWTLVDQPEDHKVIKNRWVFTKKRTTDGSKRCKARLVIKGFSQREGIDYNETFSPVARFDTVRFVLSLAARDNLKLGQFDIKTAFLHGNLEEDIYMQQPEGFQDGTRRVCKLLKSLYGLKQAPRCWTEHFREFIESLGFVQSEADPCLYVYVNGEERAYLALFVDDGVIVVTHEHLIDELFCNLRQRFEITCTKNIKNYLGIEVSRLNDGSVFICQSEYIKNILRRFGMSDANSVSTPIACN